LETGGSLILDEGAESEYQQVLDNADEFEVMSGDINWSSENPFGDL